MGEPDSRHPEPKRGPGASVISERAPEPPSQWRQQVVADYRVLAAVEGSLSRRARAQALRKDRHAGELAGPAREHNGPSRLWTFGRVSRRVWRRSGDQMNVAEPGRTEMF